MVLEMYHALSLADWQVFQGTTFAEIK